MGHPVATYCPGRMAEHRKSKSTGCFDHSARSPCTSLELPPRRLLVGLFVAEAAPARKGRGPLAPPDPAEPRPVPPARPAVVLVVPLLLGCNSTDFHKPIPNCSYVTGVLYPLKFCKEHSCLKSVL